jgi:hypothetical protein
MTKLSRLSKVIHYWDSCTFLALLKNEPDKILDTFDDGLIKLSNQVGDPPLEIQRPFFQIQLDLL